MTHGFSLTFNFPFQIRTGPLIGRLSNELPDNPENTCAEHRRALKLGAGCFWIYYQARIQNSIHASDPDLTVVIDLDLNDRCHIRQETAVRRKPQGRSQIWIRPTLKRHQVPKQRHFMFTAERPLNSVHLQLNHFLPSPKPMKGNEVQPTTSMPCLIDAGSCPLIAAGTQMRTLLHLQNHR